MKRIFTAVLSAMLLFLLCTSSFAANSPLFTFTVIDGTVRIDKYNGYGGKVNIPEKIGGMPVVSIGMFAFDGANISSVNLPSTLSEIGADAFCGCTELEAYTVAANNRVFSASDGVLYSADASEIIQVPASFTGAFIVPASVKTIGRYAFTDCIYLTSVTLPETVTVICDAAFSNCRTLAKIDLGGTQEIRDNAFDGCLKLETITLPESVTYIGTSAFIDCPMLTEISVSEQNAVFASADGVLYNREFTRLISCPEGKSGELVLPETVTEIGYQAFLDCAKITAVDMKNTISILQGAFSGCTALTAFCAPEALTEINAFAFYNCTSLSEITLSPQLDKIAFSVFYGCKSLVSVTLPDSITVLENYAFSDCTKLKSVEFSKNLTGVGRFAFNNCTSLSTADLPESCTGIAMYAFARCPALKSVTIPKAVTSIGAYAFYNTENVTFTVYKDSYAHEYVKDNDYAFTLIGEKASAVENVTLDIAFSLSVFRYVAGVGILSGAQASFADIDGNGYITVSDAINIFRIISSK